jgi:hypothetical protein
MFPQCPPIGNDEGCQVLITVNPDGTGTVTEDPSTGPYEGAEDALVGLQNNSAGKVTSINLSSSLDIFGFDGDGICSSAITSPPYTHPAPAGCPFGPTEYEGPGTSFSNISSDTTSGTVDFNPPIGPSGAACSGGASGSGTSSAYFSLEESISAADINLGTIASAPPPPGPTVGAISYTPKKSLKPTVPGVRMYINVSEPSTVVVTATLNFKASAAKSTNLGTFTVVDEGRKKLRLALPKSLRNQLKIGDRVNLDLKIKATPLSAQACASPTTKTVSLKTRVVHVLKKETNN